MIDPLPEPPNHRMNPNCPKVARAHMEALDRVIDMVYQEDYPGHDHEFTVLTVGGGKYWPGIVISCKLLRMLGYNGRIEIWHGHHGNPEEIFPEDVKDLDVHIVNALSLGTKPRILNGWEAKLHALRHCRAKKVFFLDADAYVVTNPKNVFNNLYAFSYWSKNPNEPRIGWNLVWNDKRRNVPSIQGGQFFINREECWPYILVCDWMCQHSDFYFRHMFGDEDVMYTALSIMQDIPYVHLGKCSFVDGALTVSYSGQTFVVHRVGYKLFPPDTWGRDSNYGKCNPNLPLEGIVQYLYSQIVSKRQNIVDTFKKLYAAGRMKIDDGYDLWLARRIAKVLVENQYQTVVDVGCGDGKFDEALIERVIKMGGKVSLTGIDCVEEALPKNGVKGKYICSDITNVDNIPPGDVLIAKDVLQHWGNALVERWLGEVTKSGKWKMLVVITSTKQEVVDIPHGGFRGLDPEKFPLARYGPWEVHRFGDSCALLFRSLLGDLEGQSG